MRQTAQGVMSFSDPKVIRGISAAAGAGAGTFIGLFVFGSFSDPKVIRGISAKVGMAAHLARCDIATVSVTRRSLEGFRPVYVDGLVDVNWRAELGFSDPKVIRGISAIAAILQGPVGDTGVSVTRRSLEGFRPVMTIYWSGVGNGILKLEGFSDPKVIRGISACNGNSPED